jgi:minor extracellular serine protease Vpr
VIHPPFPRLLGAVPLSVALVLLVSGAPGVTVSGDGPVRPGEPGAPHGTLVTRLVVLDAPTRWDAHRAVLARAGETDLDAASPETAPVARAAASAAGERIARLAGPVTRAVTAASGEVIARYDTALPALLVRVPAETAASLARLPGVRRVAPAPVAEVALKDSVPAIGADRVRRVLGIDGQGVNIAVADTGVDYTHAAFAGPGTEAAYAAAAGAAERTDDAWQGKTLFPSTRVIGGYDFAGPLYAPGCTPLGESGGTCSPRPAPDPDPLDTLGHGTHVAGIAAGTAVGALGDGVAPGAGIIALKIFGRTGQTELLIDPIEWAIGANMGEGGRPRVDVLNLSLGQRYGAQVLDEEGVVRRAVEAGIVVVASAGNDSYLPFITAAPGIAADALAVASHTPPGRHAWSGELAPAGGEAITVAEEAVFFQGWSPDPRGELSAPVVYVGRGCPGDGGARAADPYLADPAGAVAMFDLTWGSGPAECTADLQARRLQDAGAVGALVAMGLGMTHASPWDVDLPLVDIPVWSVNQALESAVGELGAGGARLTLRPVPLPLEDGVMSAFSSRGPARTGLLKPDLSAPGAGIFAAAVGQGRRGIAHSGTSMAAPHAAGTAALVWARARTRHWALDARDVGALVMTTTDPARLHQTTERRETPPIARGGGGALDAWSATSAETVVRAGPVASFSLGLAALTDMETRRLEVSVANHAATDRHYHLEQQFRAASDIGRGLDFVPERPDLVVPAGTTARVAVQAIVRPARMAPWALRGGAEVGDPEALADAELDGWLAVTDTTDGPSGPVFRVPFHLLARAASDVGATWSDARPDGAVQLQLDNPSPFAGTAEVFALVATDPADGGVPAKVDLDAVGVRTTPDDEGNTVVEFALHTRGARIHPLETVSLVELDTDLDGAADFTVYTADEEYLRSKVSYNGRVKVALAEPGGGPFGAATARYYAMVDLNSRYTVLPVRIEDTGLVPSTLEFGFRVQQQDFVEGDGAGTPLYDQVPGGGRWLRYDGRARQSVPDVPHVSVDGAGEADVTVRRPTAPALGLLVLLPANAPGAGDIALWPETARSAALALPWIGRAARPGR